MANLKLNNVVVVAESGGAATVQSGVFKAADGTAAFTVANSTGAATFSAAVTVPTATATGHAVTKAQLDASAHTPEGTAVLSTGETGGSKFLREDGDNSSSWQAISVGGGGFKTNKHLAWVLGG